MHETVRYIYEKDLWKFYMWVWVTKQISTEINLCLSYGSILAQSLFGLWLNPGSILLFSVAPGSILIFPMAQSLFVLWPNPGSIIICPVAHSWPGLSHDRKNKAWARMSHKTNKGWARIEPHDKWRLSQDWAIWQIRTEIGLSHTTNKDWARIKPYDK